jgi:hypothetical protein
MALSFGWRANDIRESIWIGDPSLVNVTDAALEAWRTDGDASHLEPYATSGEPTTILWRALTLSEQAYVRTPMYGNDSQEEKLSGLERAIILSFRIGCSFKGAGDSMGQDPGTGIKRKIVVNEKGIWMLSEAVVADLVKAFPGLLEFYGNLVFAASFLSDSEKKASSPPSTPTPSSAEASTAATTEPSPPVGAATGAP